MASNYFFFTDRGLLNSQSSGEFGPAGTYSDPNTSVVYDQYRVTSMHSASTDAPAYAACKGIVFVQAQGGNLSTTSLLNIVLKPFEQPPFEFPKIKYFIYKGIKKSSLLTSNDKDLIAAGANDAMLASIWADVGATPPCEVLGLDIDSNRNPDTESLDAVFYRNNVVHQLPVVKAGWKMGEFDMNGFGFEIMFESLGFEPTLAEARNHEHFVRAAQLPGSPTQAEFFEHWHDKEAILNYIDPAAFFGSFYSHKLKVYDGSVNRWEGSDLFTNVISLFRNKNTCYVDIRNEFNFSLNYFKNYGASPTDNTTNLQFTNDQANNATFNTLEYYRSGWPILSLTNADLSSANGRNTVRLKLPDGNGDNPMPLVYFSKAYYNTSRFPKERLSAEKFQELTADTSTHLTNEFSFAFPDGATNSLMSSYVLIKFCKRFDSANPPPPSSGTVLRRQNYLDLLLSFLNSYTNLYSGLNSGISVFYEEIFCDYKTQISYSSSIAWATDNTFITLFVLPETYFKSTSKKSKGLVLSSKQYAFEGTPLEYVSIHDNSVNYKKGYFVLSPSNVLNEKLVQVKALLGLKFSSINTEGLVSICLQKGSLNTINLSQLQPKYRRYFCLINKFISTDQIGQSFMRFELAIAGYENVNNQLQYKQISTGIEIYCHGN